MEYLWQLMSQRGWSMVFKGWAIPPDSKAHLHRDIVGGICFVVGLLDFSS